MMPFGKGLKLLGIDLQKASRISPWHARSYYGRKVGSSHMQNAKETEETRHISKSIKVPGEEIGADLHACV